MDRQDEKFLEMMARRAQMKGDFARLCQALTELATSEDYRKRHPDVLGRLQAAERAEWNRQKEGRASYPGLARVAVMEPGPR
jgi:hypothetical protein